MWAGLILYLRPAGRGATGGSAGPCVVAQFAAPRGHACVRARHGAEEAGTCAASRCPALCARPPSTGRAGRARGVAGASATTKHAQETQKNWLTSIFVSIVLKHTDIRARAKGPLGLGAIPPLKLEVSQPSPLSSLLIKPSSHRPRSRVEVVTPSPTSWRLI